MLATDSKSKPQFFNDNSPAERLGICDGFMHICKKKELFYIPLPESKDSYTINKLVRYSQKITQQTLINNDQQPVIHREIMLGKQLAAKQLLIASESTNGLGYSINNLLQDNITLWKKFGFTVSLYYHLLVFYPNFPSVEESIEKAIWGNLKEVDKESESYDRGFQIGKELGEHCLKAQKEIEKTLEIQFKEYFKDLKEEAAKKSAQKNQSAKNTDQAIPAESKKRKKVNKTERGNYKKKKTKQVIAKDNQEDNSINLLQLLFQNTPTATEAFYSNFDNLTKAEKQNVHLQINLYLRILKKAKKKVETYIFEETVDHGEGSSSQPQSSQASSSSKATIIPPSFKVLLAASLLVEPDEEQKNNLHTTSASTLVSLHDEESEEEQENNSDEPLTSYTSLPSTPAPLIDEGSEEEQENNFDEPLTSYTSLPSTPESLIDEGSEVREKNNLYKPTFSYNSRSMPAPSIENCATRWQPTARTVLPPFASLFPLPTQAHSTSQSTAKNIAYPPIPAAPLLPLTSIMLQEGIRENQRKTIQNSFKPYSPFETIHEQHTQPARAYASAAAPPPITSPHTTSRNSPIANMRHCGVFRRPTAEVWPNSTTGLPSTNTNNVDARERDALNHDRLPHAMPSWEKK